MRTLTSALTSIAAGSVLLVLLANSDTFRDFSDAVKAGKVTAVVVASARSADEGGPPARAEMGTSR